MENLPNVTRLQEIAYPVFRLGTRKPIVEAGLTFYYHENYEETEDGDLEMVADYRILDDKNIALPRLSLRRLVMKNRGARLYRMTHAVFFLGDLVKLAKPNIWFMDSNGKLFNYEKKTRALLKFYPISKNIAIPTGGSIIEAKGLMTRFKCLFSPETDKTHVGILHFGMTQILYGFYTEQHKDTWRMV